MSTSVEPSSLRRDSQQSQISNLIPEDSDSDSISLASTIDTQHDPDEEWTVEAVLAQRRNEQGQYEEYLIQWTGYSVHEWTWEPYTSISSELMKSWDLSKARQAEGLEIPYDLAEHEAAVAIYDQDKSDRHRRRNLKRAKLGLDLRLYEGENSSDYANLTHGGAQEDNGKSAPPAARPISPRAGPLPTEAAGKDSATQLRLPIVVGERIRQRKETRPSATPAHTPYLQTQSLAQPISASSRYQGTARKPSLPRPANTLQAHQGAQTGNTATTKPSLKAKKGSVTTRSTVTSNKTNVFNISGQKRKTRVDSGDALSDKTKDPKLYNNLRSIRQAQLRGRDKEDAAPDISQIQLFNISSGRTVVSKAPTSTAEKADGQSPLDGRASVDSEHHSHDMRSAGSVDSEQGRERPAKRIRKSVQFLDTPIVGEPMELDDGIPVSGRPSIDVNIAPQLSSAHASPVAVGQSSHSVEFVLRSADSQPTSAALRRLSLADYQSRPLTQSIDIIIMVGPLNSKRVEVKFDGITRDSEPWQSLFVSAGTLVFDHICTAQTFEKQASNIKGQTLSSGNITARTDGAALENVAAQLRMGPFGAVCYKEEYCVLVYPTKSQFWKQKIPEAEPASPTDGALRHIIFKPNPAARPLAVSDPSPMTSPEVADKARIVVLRRLLGLDYAQLLPTGRQRLDKKHHSFFLAFPPPKVRIYNLIGTWLRECNPECKLFTSQSSGDWLAFTNSVEYGTVIIHEAVIWSVRRFPDIRKLLHAKNTSFNFWSVGESLQADPMLPSVLHHIADPGSVELVRLFPHGSAVLVTPSFLVTQPRRAFEFFAWFREIFHVRLQASPLKVVACHGLEDYLLDLSTKKASERQGLFAKRGRGQLSEIEDEAIALGLTKEDCQARDDTWVLVRELVDLIKPSANEDNHHMIFASDSIDPNDEQSLVNWFGWWSTTRLDCFRKFHVLGSSENDSRKATLKITGPIFSRETVNDPEGALDQLDRANEVDDATQQGELGSDGQIHPRHPSPTEQSKSEILEQDNLTPVALRSYLWDLSKKNLPSGNFVHLYAIPVSYFHDPAGMADHFNDLRFQFESFQSWLRHPYPFSRRFNTYIGFFYTIDGDWDSGSSLRGKRLPRHPWIAIYRPINPHLQPFTATELIIWDVAAKRFPDGRQLSQRDLIHAQSHIIDYVQQHGKTKNSQLPLKQVWLGGFQQPNSPFSSPIDQTLVALESMLADPRQWLPAGDAMMPDRGFRLINPSTSDAWSERSESMSPDSPINKPDTTGDDTMNTKIIFHPPRGTNRPGRSSKCQNRFYEEVMALGIVDKKPKQFLYHFDPTLEWYIRQKAEGRAFEHINVDTWGPVFKILGIIQSGSRS